MCAEYKLNKKPSEILEFLNLPNPGDTETVFKSRVKLFDLAPVIAGENLEIRPMRFSLKPPSVKYATFNARLYDYDERANKIVSVAERRTWKKPLEESRCLIPMTGFVEPIYTGEHAGEMVAFEDKAQKILFAAGLYEHSTDIKTGAPYTGFSIVMDQPDKVVREVGHHRTPVFLQPKSFHEWLSNDLDTGDAMKVLNEKRQSLTLQFQPDRKMAKGWEKRIPAFLEKAERELHFEALFHSGAGV